MRHYLKKITTISILIIIILSCTGQNSTQQMTLLNKLGYNSDDILLIVNMDDIGSFKDETDSNYKAMEYGMAKTASIMVPAPDFERAAELAGDRPLGLHITLTNEWQEKLPWSPLLSKDEVPSLYNPRGNMWQNELLFAENMNLEDVKKEMEKQILTAMDYNLNITHMDAHMGCYYQTPELYRAALDLAKKYKLPIICPLPPFMRSQFEDEGFIFADTFNGFYTVYGEKKNPELRMKAYKNYLRNLTPGVHHLYIHPSYDTLAAREVMFDLDIRIGDFNVWTSDEIKSLTKELNIKFVDYAGIKKLQEEAFSIN